MKTKLLSIAFMAITGFSFGQTSSLWTNSARNTSSEILENKISPVVHLAQINFYFV